MFKHHCFPKSIILQAVLAAGNEYVSNEITKLINGLKEVGSKITDKVTQIKLAETIANVRKVKSVKKIKEQHLSALMMTYELLSELKQSIKK